MYAIDGDHLDLPASQDIINNGYIGYPTSKGRETHYPKMYTTQVLDIVNSQIRDFKYSANQDEVYHGREFAGTLETNSIAIYDRLHCGYNTFLAHQEADNHFIIRARMGESTRTSGKGIHLAVQSFQKSKKRSEIVLWKPERGKIKTSPNVYVRLVKVSNKKTKKDDIFVTNLPISDFKAREIGNLYRRRWDIETSFKQLTFVLKMCQWHSKKFNGILQEIFALLWLVNVTLKEMQLSQAISSEDLQEKNYRKANFKLVVRCFMDHLKLLVCGKYKKFLSLLKHWIQRTCQSRTRDARSYPRTVKHRGREYKYDNLVPRRERLTEQH